MAKHDQNDEQRAAAFAQKVKDHSGGLSDSTVLTPEQARMNALMQKLRDNGY